MSRCDKTEAGEHMHVRSPMFDGTMIDYCAHCMRVLPPKDDQENA